MKTRCGNPGTTTLATLAMRKYYPLDAYLKIVGMVFPECRTPCHHPGHLGRASSRNPPLESPTRSILAYQDDSAERADNNKGGTSMTRFTFVFTILFTLGFVSTSQAGLIAHWTGDNTAVDATGNGHNGTLVNGATFDIGVIGQAFKFDGVDDFITIPGSLALQPATISVSMWFKVTSRPGDQLLMDSSHGPGNAGWAVQMMGTNRVASQENRIDFAYGNGAGFPHVQSNAIVADDTWHHILATLDGSNMRMFVDGILDNTAAFTGTPLASTNNGGEIRLGRHFFLNRQLDGLLDDVRIFDTIVPEPSSLALLGVAGVVVMGRRRVRRAFGKA